MSTETEEPFAQPPNQDYETIIAEVNATNLPEVTEETKEKFLVEVASYLLSENIEPMYLAVKRILTISFVPILFVMVVTWLGIVVWFVYLAAYKINGFYLPDSVLIALITSTTATVLGLFHYVARWLFAVNPKDPNDPTSK